MNRRWFIWVAPVVAISVAVAETPDRRALTWFYDGTGLEIYTESTGSAQTSRVGSVGIGPGVRPRQDSINRLVIEAGNTILFAYNLEATRGPEPGTVAIRILPISPATETGLLQAAGKGSWPTFSGAHLPTVAAIREFASVRIGEAVTLDILYNPSTREKISDVIRPIAGPSPCPNNLCTTTGTAAPLPPPEISFQQITLKVNGRPVQAPPATITGAAVRIDIPGHGAYVLAAYDPKDANPAYAFKVIADADGKTLRWSMDGDNVEILSQSNVLSQVLVGRLWLYHDPRYRSRDQPDLVGLRNADKVEWLLPKK